MKDDRNNLLVTKASGALVPFDIVKLKRSLFHSGANTEQVDEIVSKIKGMLFEGISTKEIYKAAFQFLRNQSRPNAARYKLKKAIMELGPSGFPFEQFIAELLKSKGYKIKVGEIVPGHCVNHEIDVIAIKGNQRLIIECKYHSQQGKTSDVKIPLYIHSRFLDIEKHNEIEGTFYDKTHEAWIITNTRFSDDAMSYSSCMGMHLVGWDYPKNNGLKEWIDNSGLYPITSLTSLNSQEIQSLIDKKIVLCNTLLQNPSILHRIGIKELRLQRVIHECSILCKGKVL